MGRGGDQEIEKIREELRSGEEVIFSTTQLQLRKPSTFFITTERIIARSPGLINSTIDSVQWDDISNYSMFKGKLLRAGIKVFSAHGTMQIDDLNKDDTKRIREFIDENMKKVKDAKSQGHVIQQAQSPLDQLKTKFVNGEITQEEYEARKKVLEE